MENTSEKMCYSHISQKYWFYEWRCYDVMYRSIKRTYLMESHFTSLSSEQPLCATCETGLAGAMWWRHDTCYPPRKSSAQYASLSLCPKHTIGFTALVQARDTYKYYNKMQFYIGFNMHVCIYIGFSLPNTIASDRDKMFI